MRDTGGGDCGTGGGGRGYGGGGGCAVSEDWGLRMETGNCNKKLSK